MILVDTAIWIDHLKSPIAALDRLLSAREVFTHPSILGEISLGSHYQREALLPALRDLPCTAELFHPEVQSFITRYKLFGLGLGYIDAHLLASAQHSQTGLLWTRDKRLHEAAVKLGIAMIEALPRVH